MFENATQLEVSLIPCLRNDSDHFYMFGDAMAEMEEEEAGADSALAFKKPLIHLAHCR